MEYTQSLIAFILSELCLLLLCSYSPNDVPPEPQRNVSIAAVRGAVRPSYRTLSFCLFLFYSPQFLNIHALYQQITKFADIIL